MLIFVCVPEDFCKVAANKPSFTHTFLQQLTRE